MAGNTTTVRASWPRIYEVQDSITRPADTNIYAAGDVISDNTTTPTAAGYFTLDFGGRVGGGLRLTDFTLHKSVLNVTNADFAVLLMTTLPTLLDLDDNAACKITDAQMKECKGEVKFANGSWTNVALGNVQTVSQDIGVVLASDSTILYGILLAAGAYTPASGEVFTLTAHAYQDGGS